VTETVSTLQPGPRFAEWMPARPTFIVSDLDGTYITADDTAPSRTVASTQSALDAGLRFIFATGRLPLGLPSLGIESPLFGPHIVHNGAEVFGARTFALSASQSDALVSFCVARGIYAEFYTADGFYVSTRDPAAFDSWELISGVPLGLAAEHPGTAFLKATVVDFAPLAHAHLSSDLLELGLAAEASTAPIFPGALILNVTAPGVSKGTSLRWLAAGLGLDLAATTAIGDGMNDVSMLEAVGTAVVVRGAPTSVLALAHFTTAGPEDGGVADVIDWTVGRLGVS
jgi:hydroxymethylpyrimidine pyrophosphatase-like HAD family hydrolase